eukprot:gene16131-7492_t
MKNAKLEEGITESTVKKEDKNTEKFEEFLEEKQDDFQDEEWNYSISSEEKVGEENAFHETPEHIHTEDEMEVQVEDDEFIFIQEEVVEEAENSAFVHL